MACFETVDLIVKAALLWWMYSTLSLYTSSPIAWGGEANLQTLTGACIEMFTVMQKCLYINFFLMIISLMLLSYAVGSHFIPGVAVCCAPCAVCIECAKCPAGIISFVINVWGLIVFLSKGNNGDCADLYNCGWFSFVGYCIFALIGCCCFATKPQEASTAEQDEKKPLLTQS